jgi:hypothetical protein
MLRTVWEVCDASVAALALVVAALAGPVEPEPDRDERVVKSEASGDVLAHRHTDVDREGGTSNDFAQAAKNDEKMWGERTASGRDVGISGHPTRAARWRQDAWTVLEALKAMTLHVAAYTDMADSAPATLLPPRMPFALAHEPPVDAGAPPSASAGAGGRGGGVSASRGLEEKMASINESEDMRELVLGEGLVAPDVWWDMVCARVTGLATTAFQHLAEASPKLASEALTHVDSVTGLALWTADQVRAATARVPERDSGNHVDDEAAIRGCASMWSLAHRRWAGVLKSTLQDRLRDKHVLAASTTSASSTRRTQAPTPLRAPLLTVVPAPVPAAVALAVVGPVLVSAAAQVRWAGGPSP